MKQVECWCCAHFSLIDGTTQGHCDVACRVVSGYEQVCANFVLRDGLYTKREIPAYCKNQLNQK